MARVRLYSGFLYTSEAFARSIFYRCNVWRRLKYTTQTVTGIDKDLEWVRQLVIDGLEGRPARVYLFGSRATGRARRASDIDVAVWPLADLPEGTLSAIREALFETTIPYTVDLVDLRETDVAFRARVMAEGVVWHEPKNA